MAEGDTYRLMMDMLRDAVVVLGEDLRLLYVNAAAAVYFPLREEGDRKRYFLEMVHADDLDAVGSFLESLRRGAGPAEIRVRMRTADGKWRRVWLRGQRITSATLKGILLEIREETWDRRLQRELEGMEEELREYREIVEAANFGVAIADTQGFLQYVNPYFAAVHGYQPRDLLGKNLMVFHDQSQWEEVRAINERLLEEGSYTSLEVWHARRDGSVFPMLMNAVVIRDEEGRPAYMAATGVDISEQKARERELSDYRERLEELVAERTLELASANERLRYEVEERSRMEEELRLRNQELDAFAHSVSHDLRGNLTVIEGFARTALGALERGDEGEQRECLERIVESAERTQRFMESLLQYARMGRRGEAQACADVDMVLKEVLMDLEECINKAGVEVVVGEGLPMVEAEEIRVYQVLRNLLENALKFTSGVARPRVEITCTRREGEAVICVQDNGVGIPGEWHSEVFKPFFRGGGEASPGLGIGLSTVKRAVEGWNGRVWVESRPGEGAAFYFTLPLASP